MIATKSANLMVVHIAKMITYGTFGALSLSYLGYGLLIGIAALPGNWLGQVILKQISEQRFRQLVVSFVALSSNTHSLGTKKCSEFLVTSSLGNFLVSQV